MQRAGDVHHAAEWGYAERRFSPNQGARYLVNRSIAAGRNDELGALAHCLACQLGRMALAFGHLHVNPEPMLC
jgi:hypothetical protein